MKRTYGNPSTPGPGLRAVAKAEHARKVAEQAKAVKAANAKAAAMMAKGIR